MEDLRNAQINAFPENVPSFSRVVRRRRKALHGAFEYPLDRVNVLGRNHTGHTGCVNALSWARDGELLLSGGDDTTVRLWRLDPNNSENPNQTYPFVCPAVIKTGHRSNIFNAHMLPHSSRIATVARDCQIRIFDAELGVSASGTENEHHARNMGVNVLRCHRDAVKRLVTEDSPDLFLTVAEDGTVRQHDLRIRHVCSADSCPTALVDLPFDLYSIALSPLTPYQFVVSGESAFGYLYDRRHSTRLIQREWGVPGNEASLTNCVRLFGRVDDGTANAINKEHITGCRLSPFNGHEVLLTYSGDAVYLFSTVDSPTDRDSAKTPGSMVLPDNSSSLRESPATVRSIERSAITSPPADHGLTQEETSDAEMPDLAEANESDEDEDEGDEDEDLPDPVEELEDLLARRTSTRNWSRLFGNVPVVNPRLRYAGARNVRTVKDVNFLGPEDEFVTSGSDDGNFFVWKKVTGQLHGIYEGDGSVVNVIEAHPHLPLVAVSGIDHTVKLFSPLDPISRKSSVFSRLDNQNNIIQQNTTAPDDEDESEQNILLATLYRQYRLAMRTHRDRDQEEDAVTECPTQ